MLVHRRVTPSIKFVGTHLYTWVERGTVRVKCLAQEQNTMSPAKAQTRNARYGIERFNHKATAPSTSILRITANFPYNLYKQCNRIGITVTQPIFFFQKKVHVYPKLGLSSLLTVTTVWNLLIQIYPTLFMLS